LTDTIGFNYQKTQLNYTYSIAYNNIKSKPFF
jgi:hypothetical protein